MKNIQCPSTLRGKWRLTFETLTDEQKEIFNYRYNVMGQPAALAYRFATEGY